MSGLPGNHQIGKIMTVLWEWGLKGALIHYSILCDYEAGGFHCDCRLLLFKATTELGVGQIGIGQVKSAESSLFSHFSLINTP